MISNKVNIIASDIYDYGMYGWRQIFSESIYWTSCRERIQTHYFEPLTSKYIYMRCPTAQKEPIACFINAIEHRLSVKKSLIYDTNFPKALCILPSRFWRRSWMRMSFFTIIMRAALNYRLGTNPYEHLMNERYVVETQKAVERFFAGYTEFTAVSDEGWVDFFRCNSEFYLVKKSFNPFRIVFWLLDKIRSI